MERVKMSREERAKQFFPFAALKGYPAALRRKEKIVVPKVEFSEDYQERLDRRLRQIRVDPCSGCGDGGLFPGGRISESDRDGLQDRPDGQGAEDREYKDSI